jgi:hypothetical protein
MIELELTDVHQLANVLIDLKLSPEDALVPIPKHFQEPKSAELADFHKMLVFLFHTLTL